MNLPQLGWARIRHQRLRPARHALDYPGLFLMLPLRSLAAEPARWGTLARNRFAPIAFHDRDHGEGQPDALRWIDGFLRAHGVHDADGEAWLMCFPRVLGYAFKPVSFWYCERADGTLRAIVAEVNNTFGERHCYLLDGAAWGRELAAAKAFHVSPFCRIEGGYRFRFMRSADQERIVARIDHDDAAGPLLQTSISGRLQPATAGALRRAFWRFPLLTLAITVRIHWHALRLWLKRVPIHTHPARAQAPGTHAP